MIRRIHIPLFAAALAVLPPFAVSTLAQERPPAAGNPAGNAGQMAAMQGMESGRPDAHMVMTALQSPQPGDGQRAEAVVEAVRQTMAKYTDYRIALADGFRIFAPNLPGIEKHFTNYRWAAEAQRHFNPYHPTSLLYDRTPDGGWKLVGAMFTAPRWYTPAQLNQRVPLSVARWHRHVNFCFPPRAEFRQIRQGFHGSDGPMVPQARDEFLNFYRITARDVCEQAGGRWVPQIFGWMVHVYPYEKDPSQIWALPGMEAQPAGE